jgi:hypothetical protein
VENLTPTGIRCVLAYRLAMPRTFGLNKGKYKEVGEKCGETVHSRMVVRLMGIYCNLGKKNYCQDLGVDRRLLRVVDC